MAASYDFVQLDVFTQTPLAGNPLAVFTDARGLTDKQMQALSREMNLSETTFILPREPRLQCWRTRCGITPRNRNPITMMSSKLRKK